MAIKSELFLITTRSLGPNGQNEEVIKVEGPLASDHRGLLSLGQTGIAFSIVDKTDIKINAIILGGGHESVYMPSTDGEIDKIMEQHGSILSPDSGGTIMAVFAQGFNEYLCLNILDRKVGDIIQDGKLNS